MTAAPTSGQVIETRTKGIQMFLLRCHNNRAFPLSRATAAAGGEDNAATTLSWSLLWLWSLSRSKGDT